MQYIAFAIYRDTKRSTLVKGPSKLLARPMSKIFNKVEVLDILNSSERKREVFENLFDG